MLEQPWLSLFFYPYKRDCSADYVEQTCYLYWNSMLCERLDGRTGIFLKSNLFIGIIYIYFHTNIYYHISMKGESI